MYRNISRFIMNTINWNVTIDKRNYETYLELDKRFCSDACLKAKGRHKLTAYVDNIFRMLSRLYIYARIYLQNDYKFQILNPSSPIDVRLAKELIGRDVADKIRKQNQICNL